MSSSFGRAADFDKSDEIGTKNTPKVDGGDGSQLSVDTIGEPEVEDHFGTTYWCQKISDGVIQDWSNAAKAQLPPKSSSIFLPPVNPFVPQNVELKETPADDTNHPLLYCSLKVSVCES